MNPDNITPPQPQLPAHHVTNSMKIVMLLLGLALIATLGYFTWFVGSEQEAAEEVAPSVRDKTEEIPTTSDETVNWKTYTDSTNGFSFKYPDTFNARSSTSDGISESKTDLMVGADNISTTLEADGACGSQTSTLFSAQRTAFNSAKVGESFDIEFNKTDVGAKLTKIFTSKLSQKFAKGFNLCHGIVEDDDPVRVKFVALTFKGDIRVVIYATLTEKQSNAVTAKTDDEVVASIDKGTYTGDAQTIYANFGKILDTFQFTK